MTTPGTNLRDDGSYVRIIRKLPGKKHNISLTGYAVDAGRSVSDTHTTSPGVPVPSFHLIQALFQGFDFSGRSKEAMPSWG